MKVALTPPAIEQHAYYWLFQRNQQKIGVHVVNGWCTQLREEEPLYFDADERCVLLMILLELTPGEFTQHLADAKRLRPEYSENIKHFPLTRLLGYTLHSALSDYWPSKALDWLDEHVALQHLLANELDYTSTNKSLSQSLRQRAKRMVRGLLSDAMRKPAHRKDVFSLRGV
ncbi:hypothetical protein GJ698_02740 [Pseudoduganella sp. FT26W]|uniref:Uncharacterized protein n=1 Tax=Duganella aquatilis TaxID=2666082 RepID=A0A844CQK0_9BURK|nr:hypothetical protein [Duganella aquatilis]MRW83007.1 hypothetical protein [Duganella aquatilis]